MDETAFRCCSCTTLQICSRESNLWRDGRKAALCSSKCCCQSGRQVCCCHAAPVSECSAKVNLFILQIAQQQLQICVQVITVRCKCPLCRTCVCARTCVRVCVRARARIFRSVRSEGLFLYISGRVIDNVVGNDVQSRTAGVHVRIFCLLHAVVATVYTVKPIDLHTCKSLVKPVPRL